MKEYNKSIKYFLFGMLLQAMGCLEMKKQDLKDNDMEWITFDTVYDGSPLYIRHPAFKNIWEYQKEYTERFHISHKFDRVKSNGLPESDYNKSLFDFDEEICDLFDFETEGIIFLIETYGGERNYWFYLMPDIDYQSRIEELRALYPKHKIDHDLSTDKDWGFIKEYPYQLYEIN